MGQDDTQEGDKHWLEVGAQTPSGTTYDSDMPATALMDLASLPGVDTPSGTGVDLTRGASKPNWTRLWPIPFFGAAYLAHTRFRRSIPRRLPPLTSLKLPELYITSAVWAACFHDATLLEQEALRDRDIYTIHAAAHALKETWAPHLEKARRAEHLKTMRLFNELAKTRPQDSLLARLAWKYQTTGCDIVALNLVGISVLELGHTYLRQHAGGPGGLQAADLDSLFILAANTITESDAGRDAWSPARTLIMNSSAMLFAMITPLAMLARWSRRAFLFAPLNLAQRLLLYGVIFPGLALHHRRMHCVAAMHDKHAVAELCRAIIPGLDVRVDQLMKEQVAIITLS